MIEIRPALFPEDIPAVRAVFREYIGSVSVNLEFQDYETELAGLPGNYLPPDGRLMLAWNGGKVVGCVALRRIDEITCEMKRVYVTPQARGEKLGRRLVEIILDEARAAGYARICLDVLPEFTAAKWLYRSLGFQPAPAVTFNPVPGTEFLALDL